MPLGGNDLDRLTAWVDQQLDPGSIDDSEADNRIAASGFTTLDKSLQQLWIDHAVADPDWEERIRPATETQLATFIRAIYSRRQLFEVLVDFWHNHFNVYGWDFWEAPVWVHYDRDVIRANVLGNFRQMLEDVAKSTTCSSTSTTGSIPSDGPNENYARELMELHTLGSENYYGAVSRNEVPVDGDGIAVGFVDEDVFSVARCLTGWSIDGDPWWDPYTGDGGYLYRHDWHDTTAKNVLGVQLPANQPPEKDFLDVLDILAAHPGTGRFVARKLCRRLIGDSHRRASSTPLPRCSRLRSTRPISWPRSCAPSFCRQSSGLPGVRRSSARSRSWSAPCAPAKPTSPSSRVTPIPTPFAGSTTTRVSSCSPGIRPMATRTWGRPGSAPAHGS